MAKGPTMSSSSIQRHSANHASGPPTPPRAASSSTQRPGNEHGDGEPDKALHAGPRKLLVNVVRSYSRCTAAHGSTGRG